MTLLNWKPEYSVGVQSVDLEHREMIDMINQLYQEMADRKDASSIEQFLGDIHAMISAHFALEERMMQRAGYAGYDAHKNDHEKLLDQIRDLMDAFFVDTDEGMNILRSQLSDWFKTHFSTHDARLHGQLGL